MRGPARQKLEDAAKVLPGVGVVLVVVPLLWRDDIVWRSAGVLIYLFAVWFGLIVVAGVLAWRLRGDP